ncbi:MAG: pseudouridine synthase [Firmicutes bacterium]|nr:pseudouridine synthase [Candidatus Colivicinus equi]
MRINKYIASSGLCSRRKAEEYIEKGLVTINGKTAVLSSIVNEGDEVFLDGKLIESNNNEIVLLFNKPKGITCTTEHKVKENIIDFINYPERIFPIGRLDKDSQGLILLTNNGDLVNECLRVENGHEKEYVVRVDKPITSDFLSKMKDGVKIYNPVTNKYVVTLPCQIKQMGKNNFNIILKQGYNRQIRRMCLALGYHVISLKRIRFMHLCLDVEEGQYRLLKQNEIAKLHNNNEQ